MTETTVERTTRNKFGTAVLIINAIVLIITIGHSFFGLFDGTHSEWIQRLFGSLKIIGGMIALLWLALISVVSSVTMSGPSFRKTCPYTVTFLIVMSVVFIELATELKGNSFHFRLCVAAGCLLLIIDLLQMLAFSLDPHSSSIFTVFRPFRIEILTVIQLSSNAPSLKKSVRSSIV